MELRHLRSFIVLAEELNFTRAAARLHMAQPALSVQIRRLEGEVGTELLSREGRSTKLTDAGDAFLEHARKSVAHANQSVSAARLAAKGEIGHLSIGYGTAAEFTIFPTIIPAFQSKYPNVHLSFHQLGVLPQIDGLRRGEIDLAFTWLPISTTEFDIQELTKESFGILVHAHHALASATSISIKELSGEPLVLFARELNPALSNDLEQLFLRTGATMDIRYELDTAVSVLNFVAMGLGCSVVPDYLQLLSRSAVVFKRLRAPNLMRTLAIIKRKGQGGLAESFYRFTIEALRHVDLIKQPLAIDSGQPRQAARRRRPRQSAPSR
jgi:DNA-binding transcriptional LysR family regulator